MLSCTYICIVPAPRNSARARTLWACAREMCVRVRTVRMAERKGSSVIRLGDARRDVGLRQLRGHDDDDELGVRPSPRGIMRVAEVMCGGYAQPTRRGGAGLYTGGVCDLERTGTADLTLEGGAAEREGDEGPHGRVSASTKRCVCSRKAGHGRHVCALAGSG